MVGGWVGGWVEESFSLSFFFLLETGGGRGDVYVVCYM